MNLFKQFWGPAVRRYLEPKLVEAFQHQIEKERA